GQSLLDVLEKGPGRDLLERAIGRGELLPCEATTCAMKQATVHVRPTAEATGAAWVVFERSGLDDEIAFARALQEIASALGETLDVDQVCAAAVVSLVRCAQVSRAEVYLIDDDRQLRRVAASDDAED